MRKLASFAAATCLGLVHCSTTENDENARATTSAATAAFLGGPGVKIVGAQQLVKRVDEHTCPGNAGDFFITDGPARAYKDDQGRVRLISPHFMTYPFVGSTLDDVQLDCGHQVHGSHHDGDPNHFNDAEWLWSPYKLGPGNYMALVHNEWHGHMANSPLCPSHDYSKCWNNSVTLAHSSNGIDYDHAGPNQHVVSRTPFPFAPDDMLHGFYEPTNILHSPKDNAFYFLARTVTHQTQAVGLCVFKSTAPADPFSWRAWDGSSFSGVGHDGTTCAPVATGATGSVHWSTYFNQFVLVTFDDVEGYGQGFFIRFSDDLTHWTAQKRIAAVTLPWGPTAGLRGKWTHEYPSFIDPDGGDNFDVLDDHAWLYFVRNQAGAGTVRELFRVQVEFTKTLAEDGLLAHGEGCYRVGAGGRYDNGQGAYCNMLAEDLPLVCGTSDFFSLPDDQNSGTSNMQQGYGGRCAGGRVEQTGSGCYRVGGGGYYANGTGQFCTLRESQIQPLCGKADFNALPDRIGHGTAQDQHMWCKSPVAQGCYRVGAAGYYSNGSGHSCVYLGQDMPKFCDGQTNFSALPAQDDHGANSFDGPCAGGSQPIASSNPPTMTPTQPQPPTPPSQPKLGLGCYRIGGGGYFSSGSGHSCGLKPDQLARVCGTGDFNALGVRAEHGGNSVDGACQVPLPGGCYRIGGGGYYSNGTSHSCGLRPEQLIPLCGTSDFNALTARGDHDGNSVDGTCGG